jgi:hypothetical protein
MGVDICLQSVWKPFEETWRPQPLPPGADPEAFMNRCYDEMRASGGYFRNGYNSGDCMWGMGYSWDTVGSMFDEHRYLPIARARELLEMIEARPLTRERVAAHIFEHMMDGVEPHPSTGHLVQAMHEVAAEATGQTPPPLAPAGLDHLHSFLNKRRDQLIAILRKSIELNEPLHCSL